MSVSLLDAKIRNAQKKVSILSQYTDRLLLEPELLSSALEELTVVLEELHIQHEKLVQTQQELALERQQYWELFEFAPDAYFVTDKQGVVRQANQFAAQLLGVRQDFLVGKPLIVFVNLEQRQAFHNQLSKINQLNPENVPKHLRWQIEVQPRHREEFTAAIAISPVYDIQKQIIGWRWLLRDLKNTTQLQVIENEVITDDTITDETPIDGISINERKSTEDKATARDKRIIGETAIDEISVNRFEENSEIKELRSRYLQIISHEFRTPLTIIQTSADFIEGYQERITPETRTRCFQIIDKAIQSMLHLIEQASYYQAELYKPEVISIPIHLEHLCQNAIARNYPKLNALQNIEFKFQVTEPWVYIDTTTLEMILDHLLENAIKYSPQGTIFIRIEQQKEQIILEIKDQGIGINPADLPKIYEPFHRAGNVVNILPGIGLGLAIVKKLVDLLAGTITITSQMNVGTTVTVTIPI